MGDATGGVRDIGIIGAGMAGLSAAIWAHRIGLRAILFERAAQIGGQIRLIHGIIPDYPGLRAEPTELIRNLNEQIAMIGSDIRTGCNVRAIEPEGDSSPSGKIAIHLEEASLHVRMVLMATGLDRKIHPLDHGNFKNVYYSVGSHLSELRGKRLLIIGGGDGAFENVVRLAGSCRITVAFRADRPRARAQYLSVADSHPDIRLLANTEAVQFRGEGSVESVLLKNQRSAEMMVEGFDAVIVKIGFAPQSGILKGLCDLDSAGYVLTDAFQRTNHPRIWGAGDLCNPHSPSLITAAGQACVAVKSMERTLRGVNS
jgi:thioredoxin reductase (NADPH)